MINCWAFDVEILPNFFSITFVNLNDYLVKCNCKNDKGKDIPLTQKYTVKEIKEKLSTIECKQFYITDTDDSQLLEMISFINGMRAKFDHNNIPIRTDLYAYNSEFYDNTMIAFLLMNFDKFDNSALLIKKLYYFSKKLIDKENDRDALHNDPEIELTRSFKLPYGSIDVMKVFALNKAGVLVDKDTGERKAFPKSLKQTSINLQWYELLEFELPPICEKDKELYYKEYPALNGLPCDELNKIVTTWNRIMIDDYIPDMMHYNKNDVYIVCELVRQKIDEIRLRYNISSAYGVNVLSSARSNIADQLVVKFYSEMSGLHPSEFKRLKTDRTALSFKKVIFPHIHFKTEQLQSFLEDIKKVTIYRTTKSEFEREVDFYGTKYTIATGGIHSVDQPRKLVSTEDFTYVHWDYTSYYPSIMISYEVCPEHLNKKVFVKLVRFLKDTRVQAKHAPKDVQVVQGIPNNIVAEALKIVINSIYGKLGFEKGFLYDRLAQLKVTINGQLMTMTLVEELELNGIHVVSANTDGIVIKLPNNKREIFKEITTRWNETNKMSADGEEYKFLIQRDINNYMDVQTNGSIEYKGDFDPLMYIKDVTKGYNSPIVAKAVSNFFLYETPIMDSLHNETNILEFCKTQNVGRDWNLEYIYVKNGILNKINYQRNTRYYVSVGGGVLEKVNKLDKRRGRLTAGCTITPLNTLDDVPISERNIDYKFYYDECYKLINPILLGIAPKGKGKSKIKKYSGMYNKLFDNE